MKIMPTLLALAFFARVCVDVEAAPGTHVFYWNDMDRGTVGAQCGRYYRQVDHIYIAIWTPGTGGNQTYADEPSARQRILRACPIG